MPFRNHPSNPYRRGGPIRRPEDYFGHMRARHELVSLIQGGRSSIVLAPPRMGTTSLLNSLMFPDVEDELRGVVTAIDSIDCTDRIREPLDFMRRLGRIVNLHAPDARLDLNQTNPWLLADAILDIIAASNGYWVLLLDNFEALSTFPADFFDHLRACTNRSRPILIAATHVYLEDMRLPTNGGSPFGNNLQVLTLGDWTDEEFDQFLRTTSQATQVDLTVYDRDIRRLAGRVPSFVQHVTSKLYDMVVEDRVDLAELEAEAAMDLRDTFEQIWQSRTLRQGERDVLVGVVYNNPPPNGPGPYAKTLMRYGYLTEDKQIASSLFGGYLCRSIPRILMDGGARRALVAGRAVSLPRKDYDLLSFLYDNAGHVCTTEDILEHVWNLKIQGPSEATMVYQRIRALRKEIEEDHKRPRHILNVPGVGYRFENYSQAG